jgi:hypothetical protein
LRVFDSFGTYSEWLFSHRAFRSLSRNCYAKAPGFEAVRNQSFKSLSPDRV